MAQSLWNLLICGTLKYIHKYFLTISATRAINIFIIKQMLGACIEQ